MTTTLIYETHSITLDNERGISTGWLPGQLSQAGIRQAIAIGPRRRDVDVVFSSDLRRAVHTVELAGLSAPHFQDWRLRECNYGELNGARSGALEPRAERVGTPFPGGQSYADVVELTRSFLADVKHWYDGQKVLVVAHSANRWSFEHLLGSRAPIEELIAAPFDWKPGWEYEF
ncbi:histidine phosphatase family protein [Kribbella capetownensis]|uniref:phosphoglycerate mutase (2,3-diphosphoglycerate-dependent) n=1 Tax=Kribbella capetownensis TaxID=1572659 RepID=A0A4R0K2D6_9ACTN|nr:histidine phosphatase family protein [Kribbella capetownensis]TCC53217.1 histidine phosphatase family protein [Kribbella capetownensis]